MDKIIELIPERLRSRKLAMTGTLLYLITQLKSYGIEISPELQAYLLSGTGALWLFMQGVQDIVTAWRGKPAVAEASKTAPTVDTVEG